jgi:hypothetical protein
VRTILEEVLNQKVKIRVGGRTRLCTNLDAFVMTLANDSITREAKAKAQASLIGLMRWAGMMGEVSEAADSEPFTANDKILIEDFLRRRSAAFVQPDGSDGNGGSTAKSKGVAS